MKLEKHGFTLVEVIVVLVILAILAAVLIPSMTGWITKSEDMACKTQRLMVLKDIQGSLLFDRKYDPTVQANQEAMNKEYGCPGGGTYTITKDGDNFVVTCSIHGSDDGKGLSGSEMIVQTVQDMIKNGTFTIGNKIDSGATEGNNTNTLKVLEQIKAMGYDVSKAWSIVDKGNKNYEVYSAVNIIDNPNDSTGNYTDATHLRVNVWCLVTKTTIKKDGTVETVQGYAKGAWANPSNGNNYRIINTGSFVSLEDATTKLAQDKANGYVQDGPMASESLK